MMLTNLDLMYDEVRKDNKELVASHKDTLIAASSTSQL